MSIFDLIPEYETPLPRGCGTGRKIEKSINLVPVTCAQCGKTFMRHRNFAAYVRKKGSRSLRFCTWTCVCAYDRENKPKKRGKGEKTIEQRIDERMRKLCADRLLLDSEEAAQMSDEARRTIRNRMTRLVREIRALEEERENAHSGGVRGIADGDDRAAPLGT